MTFLKTGIDETRSQRSPARVERLSWLEIRSFASSLAQSPGVPPPAEERTKESPEYRTFLLRTALICLLLWAGPAFAQDWRPYLLDLNAYLIRQIIVLVFVFEALMHVVVIRSGVLRGLGESLVANIVSVLLVGVGVPLLQSVAWAAGSRIFDRQDPMRWILAFSDNPDLSTLPFLEPKMQVALWVWVVISFVLSTKVQRAVLMYLHRGEESEALEDVRLWAWTANLGAYLLMSLVVATQMYPAAFTAF